MTFCLITSFEVFRKLCPMYFFLHSSIRWLIRLTSMCIYIYIQWIYNEDKNVTSIHLVDVSKSVINHVIFICYNVPGLLLFQKWNSFLNCCYIHGYLNYVIYIFLDSIYHHRIGQCSSNNFMTGISIWYLFFTLKLNILPRLW